jgi:hypothetical protein
MEQNNAQDQPIPDTRYTFRTGWPRLSALPVESLSQDHNLPTFFPDGMTNVEDILDIVRRNGVLVVDNYLCYRYSKGAPVPEGKPTYLIYSDLRYEGQNITAWRQAVSDVISMFQQKNIYNVAIEIADQRTNCRIETDIIHSDEKEVLEAWDECMPRIAECLSKHNWVSLDLLHRSWIGAQQDAKATVVIGAADANDNEWDQTLGTLRAILPEFLGIELVYLRTILAADTSMELNEIRNDGIEWMKMLAYEDPKLVPMGASCGRHWKIAEKAAKAHVGKDNKLSLGSGTLGGLVKLEGFTQQFGLSNRHVFIEDGDQEGPEKERAPVVAPSNADYGKSLKRLEAKIRNLSLRPLKNIHMLQFNEEEKSKIKGFDRDIGRVYASSTQGAIPNPEMEENLRENWVSDWCLVELDRKKEIEAMTPMTYPDGPPAEVIEYQTIVPSELYNVMKFGKATGKTNGIVSAAMSRAREASLPQDTIRNNSIAEYREEEAGYTGIHEFRLCHAIRHCNSALNFMEEGDSGCFVLLDPDANKTPEGSNGLKPAPVVGLGFGYNKVTGSAYMMPMDLVVKDIKDVTGKRVTHPVNGGMAQPRAR